MKRQTIPLFSTLLVAAIVCLATNVANAHHLSPAKGQVTAASFGAEGCCEKSCEKPCCEPKLRSYNPCIKYRNRCTLKKTCCGCDPPVKTKLMVQDPRCGGCVVEVDVCLPACCKGEPCVKDRCGMLDRGIVTYKWCCGYKVRVNFNRCNDITVTSFGR